jgi:ferric-dicitrate binding protein FerR (iron transport regulator)
LILNDENEVGTSYGQNKTIQLPDGSVVILNANSTISYNPEWASDQPREIWLKGEAFFSVTHKVNSQKFIVHTDDLDVQVLGTKFNVNTRRENTRVILNSGKVKLYLANETSKIVEMKPGEMVNFSKKAEHLDKQIVKASRYSAWVEKKLVFEDTSIKEIAQVLEENYGMKVKFLDPELSKLTFTGTIDSGNIDLLLTILQKTFNISIIKKEDTITINSK